MDIPAAHDDDDQDDLEDDLEISEGLRRALQPQIDELLGARSPAELAERYAEAVAQLLTPHGPLMPAHRSATFLTGVYRGRQRALAQLPALEQLEALPEVLSTRQAGAMLGIDRDYLTRRLIPAGVVRPFAKMPGPNGAWLFTVGEVRRAAAAQAEAAGNRWRDKWDAAAQRVSRETGAE